MGSPKLDTLDLACWAGCVLGGLAWVAWIVRGQRREPSPTRPASIRHIHT